MLRIGECARGAGWLSLLLMLTGTSPPLAAAESSLDPVWSNMAQFMFQEALDELGQGHREGDDRSVRLTRAVALLGHPERQRANIERAVQLLEQVVQEEESDDLAAASRYFLARAAQVHEIPSDPLRAARLYEGVIRDFPRHPMAERSAVKLALLRLYAPGGTSPEERIRHAGELLGEVASLEQRATVHLILAGACLFFRVCHEDALDHLLAADSLGIVGRGRRAATLVSIGELACELGRSGVARTAYRTFLEENPRDTRAHTIRKRLEQLNGSGDE